MPLFRYEALTSSGKKIKGKVLAETAQSAKIELAKQEIAAIAMHPIALKEKELHLKKSEVLSFTKELTRLLDASLPLFEAISALEEKYRGQKLHSFLVTVSEKLQRGNCFSKILKMYPSSFDLIYIAMVANSEKTGSLSLALHEVTDLMQKEIKVKKQLISALIYPSLLTAFCFVVLSSLLFFVIPSLKELFEGRELHPFTQAVFYASDFAIRTKEALFSVVALVGGSILAAAFSLSFRKNLLKVLLKVPLFNPLFGRVALIRFSRAVATLMEGGLPLVESFEEASYVISHPVFEKVIFQAKEKLSRGEPLSKSFAKQPLIPPLVPRMLAIAEESGGLDQTFFQIAEIYEEELEQKFTHFTSLLQPLLLLFLGALVGFVLLSVLLPLTDVSSFLN